MRVTLRRRTGENSPPPETVNVEMQTTRQKHFTGRLVAYASRLYSEQLGEGEPYDKLHPVYSLAFATNNLEEFKGIKKYYHVVASMRLSPPHRIFNDKIQYIVVELGKFHKSSADLIDKRELWCYLLKGCTQ